MKENQNVRSGPNGSLYDETGKRLTPPEGWEFLPSGDAGITRKVTAKGIFWRVQVKMGTRVISKGVWAPSAIIASAQKDVENLRSTAAYQKKREYDQRRREKKQNEYEKEFYSEVRIFLSFAPKYLELEKKMAEAVTVHAIPVGSGTVARTTMISIDERASRAIIAWMRHKTTAYDSMKVPRIKGKRREVRRLLANRSTELLDDYRKGMETSADCPLKKAIRVLAENL